MNNNNYIRKIYDDIMENEIQKVCEYRSLKELINHYYTMQRTYYKNGKEVIINNNSRLAEAADISRDIVQNIMGSGRSSSVAYDKMLKICFVLSVETKDYEAMMLYANKVEGIVNLNNVQVTNMVTKKMIAYNNENDEKITLAAFMLELEELDIIDFKQEEPERKNRRTRTR